MAQLLQRGRNDVIEVMDVARSTTLATITVLCFYGMEVVVRIVEAGEQGFEEVIGAPLRQIDLGCGSIAMSLISLGGGTAHIEWTSDRLVLQ